MANESGRRGAFEFSGSWREFAPIAFTNLLLSIVTLGVYIFWARTRERQYLWSRTRFIDDQLEWTGTGFELFLGYVFAFFLFILPFAGLNLLLQGIVMRGHPGAAGVLGLFLYLLLMYLTGVAIFRALRYRLSRTFWHGIRGGADSQGLAFGWSYLWRTIVGSLVLGLMIPWSMVSLWNERWEQMSFGPHHFESNASSDKIFLKFLLFYLVPIIVFLGVVFSTALVAGFATAASSGDPIDPRVIGIVVAVFMVLIYGFALGLVAMVYYSAYFREAVGNLSLGGLQFEFDAQTWDWIKLYLGNIGLVIVTLGIGRIFIGYRNWSFFIRHMKAYGEVNLDDFTQSTTRPPGQGEGLLDAFDIGAF
jgi:uncharacterized membrane protein YjgN (DUF898 family)